MRVVGIDLETTGLDVENDSIIEMAYVLWDTDRAVPLGLESSLLSIGEKELSEEIEELTGVKDGDLKELGMPPSEELQKLVDVCAALEPEYIVAHNGEQFDKPFLMNELKRHCVNTTHFAEIPWIDTRYDLPFAKMPKSKKLDHLALDMGFINPFPHRAVTDVLTMLKVMSQFKFEDIVEYSLIPWIVVRAMVNFDNRQLAKDERYFWQQIDTKVYDKQWVKKIKANQLEEEQQRCSFPVVQVQEK